MGYFEQPHVQVNFNREGKTYTKSQLKRRICKFRKFSRADGCVTGGPMQLGVLLYDADDKLQVTNKNNKQKQQTKTTNNKQHNKPIPST